MREAGLCWTEPCSVVKISCALRRSQVEKLPSKMQRVSHLFNTAPRQPLHVILDEGKMAEALGLNSGASAESEGMSSYRLNS